MTTFWAKTPRDEAPTWGNIHPVLDHIIDVGLVLERLLDGVWRGLGDYLVLLYDEPGRTLRKGRTLCGDQEALCGRILCFLLFAQPNSIFWPLDCFEFEFDGVLQAGFQ